MKGASSSSAALLHSLISSVSLIAPRMDVPLSFHEGHPENATSGVQSSGRES
jgi:hypothetical protein